MRKLATPVLLVAFFIILSLTGESLGLKVDDFDRTRMILGYTIQIGVWMSCAMLLSRLINLYLWDGVITHTIGTPVPRLIKDITSLTIYFLATMAIIGVVFGQSVTGIWATSSVLGLILGFALRPMILDVFTGIAINIDNSFAIGDWIELHDRAGEDLVGQILELNWRTTRLETAAGNMLIIPNAQVGSMVISNYNRPKSPARYDLDFCLDFSVPVERAKRILLAGAMDVSINSDGMLESPSPEVYVNGPTELGVSYRVQYWIEPWKSLSPLAAKDIVSTAVIRHLQQAGLSLAYPKRDVFNAPMPERHLDAAMAIHREQLLTRISIFKGLPHEEIARISDALVRHNFKAGDDLMIQGEKGDSMFISLEGLLSVYFQVPNQGEIRVATLQPGSFFGEMSLLTGEPRSSTVRAVTDVLAYELTHEGMKSLLIRRPDLAEVIGLAAAERRVSLDNAEKNRSAEELANQKENLKSNIVNRMRSFFSGVFHG